MVGFQDGCEEFHVQTQKKEVRLHELVLIGLVLKLVASGGLSAEINQGHFGEDAVQSTRFQLGDSATQDFTLELVVSGEKITIVAEAVEANEPGQQSFARSNRILRRVFRHQIAFLPSGGDLLEL